MARKRKPLPEHELTFDIQTLSHEGRGIARVEDKVYFVFGALPSEKVQAKVTKAHTRYGEATTTQVLEPSLERVKPDCDFFSLCGGCQLQHVAITKQIEYKTEFLKDLLTNAKVKASHLAPPLLGKEKGYRQKARLGVRYLESKEELLIGFREQSSNKIARIEHCTILNEQVGHNLHKLKALLLTMQIKKEIPQIEVASGDDEVALIFRHLVPCPEEDIALLQAFGEENQFSIYLQPKGNDSVHKIWPPNSSLDLTYTLKDQNLKFQFHPLDFIQVNQGMNQQMINQALDWLSLKKEEKVLDLFCGLGNFSLAMAKFAHEVVGVEGSDTMVRRASQNAEQNAISNTQFFAFDLTQNCQNENWAKQQYDKILLDPPRTGAKEILEQLKSMNAKEILYISCNPATFARDAALLVNELGYHFIKVGVMDMFPHTAHVEVMGLFSHKKGSAS